MALTILIVEDEENQRHYVASYLNSRGYEVIGVGTLREAREHIQKETADVVLLDVQLPDGYGPVLLEETAYLNVRPPIIVITAYGHIEMAVDAMKNGAHDFIPKPIVFPQLDKSLQRAEEIVKMRRELAHYRNQQRQEDDMIWGKTAAMERVYDLAHRAATSSLSVLITGETGTGKELLARAIYKMGPRANKMFTDIPFPNIQPTVFESELFGHEPGGFTSADKRKPGLFEVADGGIIFLDEIATTTVDIQAKLLRVLEERSFRRVGGTNLIRVDVQFIAASNRDLQTMIREGLFREDLYYRLKVLDLHLPPLRERREDIPDLVGLFIRKGNMRMAKNISDVTPRAMEALVNFGWKGNIRELRNYIETAMVLCDDASIDLPHLPIEVVDHYKKMKAKRKDAEER